MQERQGIFTVINIQILIIHISVHCGKGRKSNSVSSTVRNLTNEIHVTSNTGANIIHMYICLSYAYASAYINANANVYAHAHAHAHEC